MRPRWRRSPTAVGRWVRSGAVVGGRVRLCLRVHEPDANARPNRRTRPWWVELLVQDADEPSLVVPSPSCGPAGRRSRPARRGDAPVAGSHGPGRAGAGRRAGRTRRPPAWRSAPASVWCSCSDGSRPWTTPAWPSCCRRGGAGGAGSPCGPGRGSSSSGPRGRDLRGGSGLGRLVSFTWEAALGEPAAHRGRPAPTGRAAAEAKQSLVRTARRVGGGRRVGCARAGKVGSGGQATVGDLLRPASAWATSTRRRWAWPAWTPPRDLGVAEVEPVEVVASVGWASCWPTSVTPLVAAATRPRHRFEGELPPVPGARRRLARVPGPPRPGRLPRRRHGSRQDRPAHRHPARRAGGRADPGDVPGVGAGQLAAGAGAVRPRARGARPPRRRTLRRRRHAVHRARAGQRHRADAPTRCWPATPSISRRCAGGGSCSTRPSRSRTPAPPPPGRCRALAPTGGSPSPARPVENRLTSCGRSCRSSTRGCSARARSFRGAVRRADRARARPRRDRAAAPGDEPVRAAPAQDRQDRSSTTCPTRSRPTEHCPLTREQATLYQAVVDDLLAGADQRGGHQPPRRGARRPTPSSSRCATTPPISSRDGSGTVGPLRQAHPHRGAARGDLDRGRQGAVLHPVHRMG